MAHRRAGHAALGIEITSRHTIRPRPQSRGLALSVVPYPLDPGSLRVRETQESGLEFSPYRPRRRAS